MFLTKLRSWVRWLYLSRYLKNRLRNRSEVILDCNGRDRKCRRLFVTLVGLQKRRLAVHIVEGNSPEEGDRCTLIFAAPQEKAPGARIFIVEGVIHKDAGESSSPSLHIYMTGYSTRCNTRHSNRIQMENAEGCETDIWIIGNRELIQIADGSRNFANTQEPKVQAIDLSAGGCLVRIANTDYVPLLEDMAGKKVLVRYVLENQIASGVETWICGVCISCRYDIMARHFILRFNWLQAIAPGKPGQVCLS